MSFPDNPVLHMSTEDLLNVQPMMPYDIEVQTSKGNVNLYGVDPLSKVEYVIDKVVSRLDLSTSDTRQVLFRERKDGTHEELDPEAPCSMCIPRKAKILFMSIVSGS